VINLYRLALGAGLLIVTLASATEQARTPVKVLHTGEDSAGKVYVYELREAIRGSHGMRLVEADYFGAHIRLSIITIDPHTPHDGTHTLISTSVLVDSLEMPLGGAYLTAQLQSCARKNVGSCAKSLMSLVDGEVAKLRTKEMALWKQIHKGGGKP
jgi:hypothetical protein